MIFKNLDIYFSLIIIFVILYFGKFLLLPLFFSIFIFIILKSFSKKISKINFYVFKIGYGSAFVISSLFLLSLIYFFGILLNENLSNVIFNSELYQSNLTLIFNKFKDFSERNVPFLTDKFVFDLDFTNLFTKVLNSFTNLAGNFSIIILYLIFIIIEEKFFKIKIQNFFSTTSSKKIIEKINLEIFNYFQIKTFTSLLTGLSTFFIMKLFNSDLAVFFGILSFILNFIPFLGSLLSVILPFIFSLIQFLNPFESSLIIAFLLIIQISVGNFIEPKLMSKSLNLSPMIMLIFLSLMGKLWGIGGMFLSVPFLVILLIVFSNIKSTKKIAIFLSEKGQIS